MTLGYIQTRHASREGTCVSFQFPFSKTSCSVKRDSLHLHKVTVIYGAHSEISSEYRLYFMTPRLPRTLRQHSALLGYERSLVIVFFLCTIEVLEWPALIRSGFSEWLVYKRLCSYRIKLTKYSTFFLKKEKFVRCMGRYLLFIWN